MKDKSPKTNPTPEQLALVERLAAVARSNAASSLAAALDIGDVAVEVWRQPTSCRREILRLAQAQTGLSESAVYKRLHLHRLFGERRQELLALRRGGTEMGLSYDDVLPLLRRDVDADLAWSVLETRVCARANWKSGDTRRHLREALGTSPARSNSGRAVKVPAGPAQQCDHALEALSRLRKYAACYVDPSAGILAGARARQGLAGAQDLAAKLEATAREVDEALKALTAVRDQCRQGARLCSGGGGRRQAAPGKPAPSARTPEPGDGQRVTEFLFADNPEEAA